MQNSDISFNVNLSKEGDLIQLNFIDNLAVAGYGVDCFGLIEIKSPLGIIYQNAGYTTDDYSAPDIDTTNVITNKLISLYTDGVLIQGLYTVSYKLSYDAGSDFYYKSIDFEVDFVCPETTLEVSHTISTGLAYLRSRDISEYGISVNGLVQNPFSTTFAQTIVFPLGSNHADATDTTGDTTVQLWSQTYSCKLNAIIFYNQLFIKDLCYVTLTVTNETVETHFVEDTDCGCLYFNCIANLKDKYDANKVTNKVEALKYQKLLEEITYNWTLKQMAESCGFDSTEFCMAIKELAQAEDCLCNSQVDNTPHLITGSSPSESNTVVGTNWLSGAVPPDVGQGVNDDFYAYFETTQYSIYKKESGVWNLKGTYGLQGATGSNGSNGSNGATGAAGINGTTVIVAKNIEQTQAFAAGVLANFGVNYVINTAFFSTYGDKIRATTSFTQDPNASQYVSFKFNNIDLGITTPDYAEDVKLIVELTYIYLSGGNGTFILNAFAIYNNMVESCAVSDTITISMGLPNVIRFSGWSMTDANITLNNCIIEKSTGGLLI